MKGNLRVIDLSVRLDPHSEPRRLKIRPYISEQTGTTMHEIDTMSHIGTHVEAPSHYVKGSKDVAQLAPALFLGEGMVLHFSFDEPYRPITTEELEKAAGGALRPGDIVFMTNSHPPEGKPYLSTEGARWLLDKGVKMIGFDDSISVEPPGQMTTHELMLGNDIPIIENLTNLEQVREKRVFLIALPLFIEGLDSSPLRAVAIEGFL
jgi:arylformamidase